MLLFHGVLLQIQVGGWKSKGLKMKAKIFDTLVATRLIWSDIKEHDFKNVNKGYPTKLIVKFGMRSAIMNFSPFVGGLLYQYPR